MEVIGPASTELFGLDATTFDITVDTGFCDAECSFLLVQEGGAQGNFYLEALTTGVVNTIIWAEQGEGELPVVIVIAGNDEAFQQSALDVINSGVISS